MNTKYGGLLAAAGIIRVFLIWSDISTSLGNRSEVSTPLNSFKRVQEGIYLYNAKIDPYLGDMVHETPLLLVLIASIPSHLLPLFYVLVDLLTSVLLLQMAKGFVLQQLATQKEKQENYAADSTELQVQSSDLLEIPKYVFIAYLFNPFTIASCVGLTSTVFSNCLLAAFFYFLVQKNMFACLLFLALEANRSLYPVALIAPAILTFSRKSVQVGALVTSLFLVLCAGWCWINFMIMGSWTFLNGTLGFIFFYRDLQPNIGLFWYFFTEMFEHFRTMFLATFQMNATVLYLIPLSLKLRREPLMLATILISLAAIFRSYPCVGDVAFYLALLPLWKRCWKFMAHNFIVFCFFLVTMLIMPVLWYLWIYAGSANANFYFGATLAFSTGQIFLVTDLLFAYVKREFCLVNGQKIFIDGKEAKIILE